MSVRPLEDRILIKPIEPETKTASGIFLPESAKEKPMQGKVVATGPGKLMENGEPPEDARQEGRHRPLRQVLRDGDRDQEHPHLIVRESELLGVIEG